MRNGRDITQKNNKGEFIYGCQGRAMTRKLRVEFLSRIKHYFHYTNIKKST